MSASVADSLLTASLETLSPAAASDAMPAVSEPSLNNSFTEDPLSGSGYLEMGDDQLDGELGTFDNGVGPTSLAVWRTSPTSPGVTHENLSMATSGSILDFSSYDQGAFRVLKAQKAKDASLTQGSRRTRNPRRLTPIVQDVPTSSSHIQLQRQNRSPFYEPGSHHTPRIANDSSGMTKSVVTAASQNILREDYLRFLEMGLPRWKRDTLWSDENSLKPSIGASAFHELELAYSSVCKLDIRMGDDAIRNRMALIRLHLEYNKAHKRQSEKNYAKTIGRGGTSVIIDAILESIHKEWKMFDSRKKSELRIRFHDRKRYGKRWLLLTNALGPSILLLCSSKMANMVYGPWSIITYCSTSLMRVVDTIPQSRSKRWDLSRCRSRQTILIQCAFSEP